MRLSRFIGALALGLGLFAIALVASLGIGARVVPPAEVWQVLLHRDASETSAIVWSLRIPRTLTGVVVGMAYGVAVALIQALTRNPLADSGILGVNAGAGFAVTITLAVTGTVGVLGYVWSAFLGAGAATIAVYVIGSYRRWTADPAALVLAGVALGAVLGGISSLLTLLDPTTFEVIRRWGLGSIAVSPLRDTASLAPFILLGVTIAIAQSRNLNSIALGDEAAASLGVRVVRARVWVIVAVTLLAGAATALTGGIGLVGLMVPHIVRWLLGPDQRFIIGLSVIYAPALILASDVLGRVIARPGEIEVGLVTAALGAPLLIALARRRTVSGL